MIDSCSLLEKSNMLLLSKEMNEKGHSLRTQILMSKKLKKYGPKIDFFEIRKVTLTFPKKIFRKTLWPILIKQQFQQ